MRCSAVLGNVARAFPSVHFCDSASNGPLRKYNHQATVPSHITGPRQLSLKGEFRIFFSTMGKKKKVGGGSLISATRKATMCLTFVKAMPSLFLQNGRSFTHCAFLHRYLKAVGSFHPPPPLSSSRTRCRVHVGLRPRSGARRMCPVDGGAPRPPDEAQ